MLVIAAAHLSARRGHAIAIDYAAGCRNDALKIFD
jgi:hypothetical protein